MGACHSTGKNLKNSAGDLTPGSPTPTLEDMWNDGEAVATLSSPRKKRRRDLSDKVQHALKDAKHLGQDVIRKLRRELGDFHYHAETCIPGIYSEDGLHDIVTDLFHSNVISEADILIKTGKSLGAFKEAQGKPRTVENYRPVWQAVRKALKDDSVQFPEALTPDTLQRLVAHNPFVTMGLSFEDNQICWNASTRSKNPVTAAVMSALSYKTACLYFSPDLMPTVLELEGEGKFTPDHPEFDTKLRAFITPLLYFFEVVHATLHVWTYVMLNAADFATFATDMAGFVHQYEPNIFLKYQEVALLLFKKKGGVLTGGLWKNVNYDNCMAAAKKIFELMSAQKNSRDWYENVFCAGCHQLIDNDAALPLAKPYVQLFEKLSSQTMNRLRQEVEDQYFVRLQDINDKLVEHLNLVDGKEDDESFFNLKNFSQWIECQGMAGVLHGSTLGLTRLIFTKYNVLDGDWSTETIDENFQTAGVAVGTLLGLEEEHAVNEKKPLKCTAFYKMMGEFESETHRLQREFWDSLPEEEKTEYRWIFSVWGPNMLDSTQLTVTTYV
jgi:hypothetical protein